MNYFLSLNKRSLQNKNTLALHQHLQEHGNMFANQLDKPITSIYV